LGQEYPLTFWIARGLALNCHDSTIECFELLNFWVFEGWFLMGLLVMQ
jgi:hypothetical protein